jgi:hypothetical protein
MAKLSKHEERALIASQVKGTLGRPYTNLVNFLDPCCPVFVDKFTSTAAGELDTSNLEGAIIYVTDTDETFTSTGFWGYESQGWIKL